VPTEFRLLSFQRQGRRTSAVLIRNPEVPYNCVIPTKAGGRTGWDPPSLLSNGHRGP